MVGGVTFACPSPGLGSVPSSATFQPVTWHVSHFGPKFPRPQNGQHAGADSTGLCKGDRGRESRTWHRDRAMSHGET